MEIGLNFAPRTAVEEFMTRRTAIAQRQDHGTRRAWRRLVMLVLASELVIALALRLAVGAPADAATQTATAVAPLEIPAPPALLQCDQADAPRSALRVCDRR